MPSAKTSLATLLPSLVAALAGTAVAVPPLPFPAVFELSSLDGANGFVINGIDAEDGCGWSVSSAGDVNGDGIDDLIIGAVGRDPNYQSDAGVSYVVFGRVTGFAAAFDLSTLDGTNGFVLNGVGAGDASGWAVDSAGDIDGDGIGDLIIGARFADPNGQTSAGESYIVFGRNTGFSSTLNLSSLDGTTGFVVTGINASDFSGISVSAAGDVNGDGIGDMIIGAREADPNGQDAAGEAYVVFGKAAPFAASFDLATLNGTNGFVLNGIGAGDFSGISVSAAGDVNGDGVGDMIIGASGADANGQDAAGEAYVVFGKAAPFAASFDLATLNGTNGFVLNGIGAGDFSGISVSSAGDVNGDGVGDMIIGASGADPNGQTNAGESYVVFGGPGVGAGGSINLSSIAGSNGFVINGIGASNYSGGSVSSAGDVNGDGLDDLIIGARNADPNGQWNAGQAYVVFGKSTGFAASLNPSTLSGVDGFVMNGVDEGDRTGTSVSSAGDVNGDGIGDMIIGAPFAGPGKSYVVFGRRCPGDINSDGDTNAADFVILAGNFGASVTPNTNGDLNGDGIVNAADFVILAGDFGCGT